jgi:hypothetical protein
MGETAVAILSWEMEKGDAKATWPGPSCLPTGGTHSLPSTFSLPITAQPVTSIQGPPENASLGLRSKPCVQPNLPGHNDTCATFGPYVGFLS